MRIHDVTNILVGNFSPEIIYGGEEKHRHKLINKIRHLLSILQARCKERAKAFIDKMMLPSYTRPWQGAGHFAFQGQDTYIQNNQNHTGFQDINLRAMV